MYTLRYKCTLLCLSDVYGCFELSEWFTCLNINYTYMYLHVHVNVHVLYVCFVLKLIHILFVVVVQLCSVLLRGGSWSRCWTGLRGDPDWEPGRPLTEMMRRTGESE